MEKIPNKIISAEQYEKLLVITLADVTTDDFINPTKSRSFQFSVTPEFAIYITGGGHGFLADKYGIDSGSTITEGYIYPSNSGDSMTVQFKLDHYQPSRPAIWSGENLANLKEATRKEILDFINHLK